MLFYLLNFVHINNNTYTIKNMLSSDYLSNLNEKQQEAVLYLDGLLLIVAGAIGKTKF